MEYNHEADQEYDEEHARELESRLYEQIYYSNSIIGEESASVNFIGNQNSLNNSILDSQKNHNENNISNTSPKISLVSRDNMAKETSTYNHTFQDSPRETLITDYRTNTYNKRRKEDENIQNLQNQVNLSNFVPTTSSTPVSKKIKPSNDKTINPYHRKIFNNSKKDNYHSLDKSAELKDTVIIVDSSESESSKDSTENDYSKYNVKNITDKNLKSQVTDVKITNRHDYSSDSEESIFEVPVPPKPKPLLIDLKDSDNENNFDDSSDEENLETQENISATTCEVPLENLESPKNDVLQISDEDEPSDLIFNCSTEIQRGASSLSEIKKLSSQSSDGNDSDKISSESIQDNFKDKNDSLLFKKPAQIGVKKLHCTNKSDFLLKNTNNLSIKSTNNVPSSKNITLEEYFFQPMSDDMKSFYNDSWGGENFDVNQIKRQMSSDPHKWAILNDDLVLIGSQRRRYFGPTCTFCQKNGHMQHQCPEKRSKIPICHMCGKNGHYDFACPDKLCLTCGKKSLIYKKTCSSCQKIKCARCHSVGHTENLCPDLWRCYHDTVKSMKAKVPKDSKSIMKPREKLYCCNCAKRGHDSTNCRKLKWSQHFVIPSHVTDYSGPHYFDENEDFSNDDLSCINESSFIQNLNNSSGSSSVETLTNFNNSENNLNLQDSFSFKKNGSRGTIFKLNCSGKAPKKSKSMKLFKINLEKNDDTTNWKTLSEFLEKISSELSGRIRFEEYEEQCIRVTGEVSKAHRIFLLSIIEQYAARNNYERTQMLLTVSKSLNSYINLFDSKLLEMNSLKENVNELYTKITELMSLLSLGQNESNHQSNIIELSSCRQKLVMILYREGFMGDSLKTLKKICNKFANRIKFSGPKSDLAKFEDTLGYLSYYNKIFTPYHLKSLNSKIQKYLKMMDLRENLKNNPILVPDENNKTNKINESKNIEILDKSTSNIVQQFINSVSTKTLNTEISQTSNNASLETIPEINQSLTQEIASSNNPNSEKEINLPMLKVGNTLIKPHPFYCQFLQVKKEKAKKRNYRQFKKFIMSAKNLLNEARDLKMPNMLNRHIKDLEKKLRNEIFVQPKDVKVLQKLVEKCKEKKIKSKKKLESH